MGKMSIRQLYVEGKCAYIGQKVLALKFKLKQTSESEVVCGLCENKCVI